MDDRTFMESKREMSPFAKGYDLHRSTEITHSDEAWSEESLWDSWVRKACPKTGSGSGSDQEKRYVLTQGRQRLLSL